nr:hypothetical protein [Tanacetum cinerariifolium]
MKSLIGMPNIPSDLNSIVDFLIPLAKMQLARSVIAKLVFAASCYFIWQERNNRLFMKSKRSKDQVIDIIKSIVRLKLLTCKFKKTKNVQMMIHLWKLPNSLIGCFIGGVLAESCTLFSSPSQMHNNIMAVGSRDHPPMLATGRYAQWQSRFLRYIDTRPNGDALRKCILEGPYTHSTAIIPVVPTTKNSPAVPERTTVETTLNMSCENKAHFESEKEAIHLILTGIGDEIYSTGDACKTAHEMWEAIERLQQGESLNIQDV